jgi:GT2 family glycosyltransferase
VVVVDPATPRLVRDALAQRDVVIIPGARPFNYAAACNAGAAAGDGDIVVLLNDDTRTEQPGWLRVLSSFFADPDVGVVGARLLHADGTLQHGGLLLNEQPLHIFHGYAGEDPGPFDLLRVDREVSAVTGACLATPRSIWDELGGLDPAFALAGNDVDYCLRARRTGRRVIWTPDATLYHFESQSRGVDTAPGDVALLYERWSDAMIHDPYGHPEFEPRQAEWIRRQPLGADQRLWRSLRRAARWRPKSRH